MKNIYLMRHGETLFNVQKRTQGWSDSPLTENGIVQALKARQFMANAHFDFDVFYCSTSERTSDTLELVFPEQDYQRIKGLKEMNFGSFEGYPASLEVCDKSVFYKDFGGETREELVERFKSTLLTISANPEYQEILCVTHGAASWFFLEDVVKPEKIPEGGFQNLDVMHLTYNEIDQNFSLIELFKTV